MRDAVKTALDEMNEIADRLMRALSDADKAHLAATRELAEMRTQRDAALRVVKRLSAELPELRTMLETNRTDLAERKAEAERLQAQLELVRQNR